MIDFDVKNYDLVFQHGDFTLAAVPQAMPFVVEVCTRPGSWALDEFFGVNLKALKESARLDDVRMLLIAFNNVYVNSFKTSGNSAVLNATIGGVTIDVSL